MATRKGDVAKATVTQTILNAFQGSFVQDKKIYVTVPDVNGEQAQIAISLTMPKVAVAQGPAATSTSGGDGAWSNDSPTGPAASSVPTSTELSQEDKDKVQELMKKLNIF